MMIEAKEQCTNLSDPLIGNYTFGNKIESNKIDKEAIHTDPEDYFYLIGFENKIGTIFECNRNGSGIYAYRVEFSRGQFEYFYEKDFDIEEQV